MNEHVVEHPMPGVDARFHRFTCGDEVDTYAVVTDRYVVVLDTHSTPALGRELRSLVQPLAGDRRLLVVNSHADYDHAWGNQAFSDVPVLGHLLCAERLRGPESRDALKDMALRQPGRFDEVVPTPPDLVFDGPFAIYGGDLTLEFLPAPGHSDDQIAAHVPELGVLLVADAAEWPWPHVASAGGLVQARASLERLLALAPAAVLPCHGGVHDTSLLRLNIAYLDAVAADPGLSLAAAAELAGADAAALPELYRDFHADACRAAADLA